MKVAATAGVFALVNSSLILFVKMAASALPGGRGLAADVVIWRLPAGVA